MEYAELDGGSLNETLNANTEAPPSVKLITCTIHLTGSAFDAEIYGTHMRL